MKKILMMAILSGTLFFSGTIHADELTCPICKTTIQKIVTAEVTKYTSCAMLEKEFIAACSSGFPGSHVACVAIATALDVECAHSKDFNKFKENIVVIADRHTKDACVAAKFCK